MIELVWLLFIGMIYWHDLFIGMIELVWLLFIGMINKSHLHFLQASALAEIVVFLSTSSKIH